MNITVVAGKGDKVRNHVIDLPESATVKDLKKKFASIVKKDIHRISFKKEDPKDATKVLRFDDDSKTLSSYGLGNSFTVTFKDLGAQIGYRTVFLVEYFGPILFVLFYYLRPAFIYGPEAVNTPYNWVAQWAVYAWVVHFLKREFETIFIHKFSRATMPLSNIFKNCAYYWTFGAVIGYPLCSPTYEPPSENFVFIGLIIFILSEIGNLICHIMLSNMRPKEGSTKRDIPRGFLFEYVACPNYTYEVASWIGFSIMTQIPFSYLFTLVGFLQMRDWAMKKHRQYKKDFPEEYPKLGRKAIIPFIH
jgi:very-long-chain enoyl-CoA reductase